jgi:hypothetical protein
MKAMRRLMESMSKEQRREREEKEEEEMKERELRNAAMYGQVAEVQRLASLLPSTSLNKGDEVSE